MMFSTASSSSSPLSSSVHTNDDKGPCVAAEDEAYAKTVRTGIFEDEGIRSEQQYQQESYSWVDYNELL